MIEFDYNKTVGEVEQLIKKIEDPATGVEEAEKLIKDAAAKLDKCYGYLRSERENLE